MTKTSTGGEVKWSVNVPAAANTAARSARSHRISYFT
jgi:hypothetical protein